MPYLNYLYAVSDKNFLDCTLYYEPATPATFDEPGDPGSLSLDSVKVKGVEILEHLSYATIQHIEQCAEVTFDTMGDSDD
jgi:hypothetical protein